MGTVHGFSSFPQGPDLSDPIVRARVSAGSLRAVFRVFERWGVEPVVARTLLGDPPRSTYFAWKKGTGPVLTADGLTRVSYLLGIYEALQRLFGLSREPADQWVIQPNSASLFGGKRPLDIMAAGGLPGLHAVRSYLETAVGNPPTRETAMTETKPQ